MKILNHVKTLVIIATTMVLSGCADFLDITPKDRITADQLFKSKAGIKAYMAGLYDQMPVIDFQFEVEWDMGNYRWTGGGSNLLQMWCDECTHKNEPTPRTLQNYWSQGNSQNKAPGAYVTVRNIYTMLDVLPSVASRLKLTEAEVNEIKGECKFLLGYVYFELAKRYGGVSIVKGTLAYDPSNPNNLYTPRSTEKQTWDYVLELCDEAIELLPPKRTDDRANRYYAYALKSRAALYAGTLAKYWSVLPAKGEAADLGLVGLKGEDAEHYLKECMSASEAIIDPASGYGLYKPNPASREEAAANYQLLFMTPTLAAPEIIALRGYNAEGTPRKHNIDVFCSPFQTRNGFPTPSRMYVTLQVVDSYEDYSNDDVPGYPARSEGRIKVTHDKIGSVDPTQFYDIAYKASDYTNYIKYKNPMDIYKGRWIDKNGVDQYDPKKEKDARLFASVILPGCTWKNTTINIQQGLILEDKTAFIGELAEGKVAKDGNTYYSFGSNVQENVSAFLNVNDQGTKTGFLMKKFLQEPTNVLGREWQSTNPWIIFRYGEILLNYAEAVAELSENPTQIIVRTNIRTKLNATKIPVSEPPTAEQISRATEALNATRHRAAHKSNIELTVDNVREERRVEMMFEHNRYFDLMRWRTFHLVMQGNNLGGPSGCLLPFRDLASATATTPPPYIFVRNATSSMGTIANQRKRIFTRGCYYGFIPNADQAKVIQNDLKW